MSIVPSDSASQQGVPPSELVFPKACQAPVYPSPDLLSAVGPARYCKLLDVYEKQMGSYYAAYQSYCRAVTSVGSISTSSSCSGVAPASVSGVSAAVSTSLSSSSGSSGSRVGGFGRSPHAMSKSAVRRLAKTMRAKGVTSSLPGGYCYSRLVRPEARESVAMALGSYPALGDLLSRPREEFLPLSATADVCVTLGSTGVAHVDYSSSASLRSGYSYNHSVSRLALDSEFSFGSYGHMLRGQGLVSRVDGVESVLSLNTPVGGFGCAPVGTLVGDDLTSLGLYRTGERFVSPEHIMTTAAKVFGVTRSVGGARRWSFAEAVGVRDPVWTELVEPDGACYRVALHVDGSDFLGFELYGSSRVFFPLFSGDKVTSCMFGLLEGSADKKIFVTEEVLCGLR